MQVITGAAGFIGSCLAAALLEQSSTQLVLVDDFTPVAKRSNWEHKSFHSLVDRSTFFQWLTTHHHQVDTIYHLGARTNTTLFDPPIFERLNVAYTKRIWDLCTLYEIPLIYASSAATYGDGALGYEDQHQLVPQLKPLNPYGVSKNKVDQWILEQSKSPPYWYGLKFFNVYGPNEYHKGRMASVVFHAFRQIQTSGQVKLFRSHHPDYKDGYQLRDFIYVKDVLKVIHFLKTVLPPSGLYNVGTGKAAPFLDLAKATFAALDLSPQIEFIDTPLDIRDKYQYFTEAKMNKLLKAGYQGEFRSLAVGIQEYVQQYLMKSKRW